jgi:hypothetical protein
MLKILLIIGLLVHATTNLKMGTNIRNFMSSRPPGKQTVSIDSKSVKNLIICDAYRDFHLVLFKPARPMVVEN